jgi:SSS family transporter
MRRATRPASLLRALLLTLVVALLPAWATAAENLATLRRATLPAPPADVEALLAVDPARLLAVGATGAWLLDATGRAWSPAAWQPPAALLGHAAHGRQAVALFGADGVLQHVQRLTLDAGGGLQVAPLAPPPGPLRHARAALNDTMLVLAGIDRAGRAALFEWRLDAPGAGWTRRPGWPGDAAPDTLLLQTRAVFVGTGSALWRWNADQGWVRRTDAPGAPRSGFSRALGQAHGLYVLAPAPGRPAALATMHTITGGWVTLPGDGPLEPRAVAAWGSGLAWVDGSGGIGAAELTASQLLLQPLDWLVIAVYLFAMLAIGLHFYRRERRDSTASFFVGGRSIPFWAAGISLYATNTSSISYVAIPAKAFETNWQYMTNNLIAVLGLMFVAAWIVPLLRRLDLMSVFAYLETRFHPAIRMLASALFMLTQLGSRLSVILFLPSLAIATITGIPVEWSILLMGGFTIVYTALGGMKAVIWTDIAQFVVMFGGAAFAIGFIMLSLDGGAAEFVRVAAAEDKTRLLDFSFDLTKATVWGFVFLVLFDVVLTFPKDQVLMQRTLSTPSAKAAGRSIWAFAAIMVPGGIAFYSIGTALYVYYRAHPERLNPLLPIDATFPLFIAAELPVGVTGLIIAGIFAAAMSTLSSIINSLSTLACVDFYEKLVKNPDPARSVRFAEWMTVVAGLLGIGFALVLSRYDIHSLFDVSIELAGLLGGGFAGAYTLGMFTRRANAPGVAIGVAGSIVLTTVAWSMSLVHPYFYLAISILLCIVIGYAASLLFPPPQRSLRGLTIYRQDADSPGPAG